MPFRTCVLFGGTSTERRVSVASATSVVSAVSELIPLFIAPNGAVHPVTLEELLAHEQPFERDFLPRSQPAFPSLASALDAAHSDDVFWLALHGGDGENGAVQSMLEQRRLAFTGSGAAASASAFDKVNAKRRVASTGVRCAASYIVAGSETEVQQAIAAALAQHGRIVAKPVADGSSVGLHHISSPAQIAEVAQAIARGGVRYLVEPFVAGTELTVGVVDPGGAPWALPPSEIRIEPGRAFDFAGKYLGRGSIELTPAQVPAATALEAQQVAIAAHRALDCEGYTRTDVIASDAGVVYLETNTLPGLTSASFLPQQLQAAGKSLRWFVAEQIRVGRERRAKSAGARG